MTQSEYSEKMRNLTRHYLESLRQKMTNIEYLWKKCANKKDCESEAYEELVFTAHRLAGTGALYGVPSVSIAAKKLEYALGEENDGSISDKIMALRQEIERSLGKRSNPV